MVDTGADAVIGGHPHVTQEVVHYQGKPIIYSVGNFVMKETDNERQRRGWVLRLELDRQGVRRLQTFPAKISLEGIPQRDREAASPCWQRGEVGVGQCPSPD
jgi:poly-gamma-glutamate synthesis protein (capsule biosynthesis protein)